jgi:arginase
MSKTDLKLNLFYPQWQGSGPDRSVYYGGLELKKYYCPGLSFSEVKVSTTEAGAGKNDIFGYEPILAQMKTAREVIDAAGPARIFTVGGGCDAGVLPVSYLSETLGGKLTLIWLDAHGDLNSPRSSSSGYFYGMPVRTLLGEGDPELLKLLYKKLEPNQVVMAGLRDLDQAESDFIIKNDLTIFRGDELNDRPGALLEAVRRRGNSKIYIHLDLDVLDPDEFPFTPVPVAGGIAVLTLLNTIHSLKENFTLAGLGIFEYSPSGKENIDLLQQLCGIGAGL